MANLNREKRRILLVEDDEYDQGLVAFKLQEYKLTFSSDFDEGLSLARLGYFDLYMLDNWLPGGSGIGLCRRIREFDPHTPILFYSAAAYDRDIEAALRAGAQAYFVKPVNHDNLEQMVARLTSRTGVRDSEALLAEIAIVREELATQFNKHVERMESAKEKRLRAKEKLLRDKALIAFIAAGGTRGEFARQWPSVLIQEVRGQQNSDAASDH